jgi:hypothetical protein
MTEPGLNYSERVVKEMAVWLSHAVGVLGLAGVMIYRLIRIYCRINRVFESSKSTLAHVSGDPNYLWAEYDLGILRKLFVLIRLIGTRRTLLAVARDEASERCNRWKGIEHRSRRGTHRDRAVPGDGVLKRRFTDDPGLLISIRPGPSILKHAA